MKWCVGDTQLETFWENNPNLINLSSLFISWPHLMGYLTHRGLHHVTTECGWLETKTYEVNDREYRNRIGENYFI